MLLMTVDYPQERMSGPPFAVSESEVRALYGPEFSIQTLASRDILDEEPRFRARGLDTLAEQVFMLTRTSHLAPKS
jgi:thiopurine S-methyltransferase